MTKTFDELMADARDVEPIIKNGFNITLSQKAEWTEDEASGIRIGHRAAMDRMEPALREAWDALGRVPGKGTTIAIEARDRIRALLAKGDG